MSTSISMQYGSQAFPGDIGSADTRFPIPIVNTSTNVNKSPNGSILSTTTSITLNGFILASGESPDYLMRIAQSGLQRYFTDPAKQGATFSIICNTNPTIVFSGVYLNSIDLSESNDNWSQKIPYSITLESSVPGSGFSQLLESIEDSWNIEPLEDISYYSWNQYTLHRDFKAAQVPNYSEPPADTNLINAYQNFDIQNLLQYRITHRLGAVGKPRRINDPANPSTDSDRKFAYQEAALWVNDATNNSVFGTGTAAGSPSIPSTGIYLQSTNNLYLYNHIRTTEANVSAGSYSITDTWLALSSGIRFIEDSTWDISTDEKMTKTITLNGTIKGLEPVDTYRNTVPIITGVINAVSGLPPNNPLINANNNKFINALSGYVSGIKPYLYRRASMISSAIPAGAKHTGGTGQQYQTDEVFIGPTPHAPLNITPLNYNESANPVAGTVTYSVSYSNRPGCFLSGVMSAAMSVNDTNSVDQVAEIFVLGRQLGPILQKTGTTKSERRLNVEVVYPAPTGYLESHPNSPLCPIHKDNDKYKQLKDFVYSFRPIAADVFATIVPTSSYSIANQGQVFKTSESTNWNPFEGRFVWDVTWIYNTGTCS